MMKPAVASTDLERLSPFVGAWDTEGEIKTGPGQPSKFKTADTYEWLPGGHFLLHHFEADMPDEKVQGIEVIGYSRKSNSYPMYSFDNSGNTSLMQARVEKETWTFIGEGIRFTGRFGDSGKVFAGLWELRSGDDAAWQSWMDVKLKKIKQMHLGAHFPSRCSLGSQHRAAEAELVVMQNQVRGNASSVPHLE